jgi:enoyl-CoA hydratase/carnithine racemase
MEDTEFADWPHVAVTRRDDIVELRFHTGDGPLVWDADAHREITEAFGWLQMERSAKVVILTGTGDEYCTRLDAPSFTGMPWDDIWWEGRRMLNALNDIDVPVISVVNGPALVHSEIPVMADIVLAAPRAEFADRAHFVRDVAPGDGIHVVWGLLLGPSRSRYFLITGQAIGAEEALRLGVVHEILPAAELRTRAWEIAADLARRSRAALRFTKAAVSIGMRRHFAADLSHGMGLEGSGHWVDGGIKE